MACPASCTTASAINSCDTRTYTDGYTCRKRNMHIATVSVFLAFGIAMIVVAWMHRNNAVMLYRALMASGAVLVLLMALALIPIVRQPVVAGRTVSVSNGCSTC